MNKTFNKDYILKNMDGLTMSLLQNTIIARKKNWRNTSGFPPIHQNGSFEQHLMVVSLFWHL